MFNRPLVRRFTWSEGHDNENRMYGWKMRGFEDLDPATGYGVAHDALEHYDSTLGMDAEMQALGAILWGRWNCGWGQNGRRPSWQLTLASDLKYFIEGSSTGNWCSSIPRRVLRDSETEDAEWAESSLRAFKREAVKVLQEEREGQHPASCFRLTDAEFSSKVEDMMQWMRRGYKRVQRRWNFAGGQSAFMESFDYIAEHKYCTKVFEPGDKLKITILGGSRGVELKLRSVYDGNY